MFIWIYKNENKNSNIKKILSLWKKSQNISTVDNIFCLPEISKVNREKRKFPDAQTLNCFACSHFKEDKNI